MNPGHSRPARLHPEPGMKLRIGVALLAIAGGLLVAIGLSPSANSRLAAAPANVSPLDRVPADAGLFVHFRAGDLWNHPAVNELKKAYPKELEEALKNLERETGLRPEQIDTVTFFYPKLPGGPGDESQFVVQVTTKKPYTPDGLLKGLREKDEKPVGGFTKLQGGLVLHHTSDTQFTVLHESLVDRFKKGATKTTDGVV